MSRLSKINGKPLAVAGKRNLKVESYNVETNTWTDLPEHPTPNWSYMERYATVTTDAVAYFIGGRCNGIILGGIHSFNGSKWNIVGGLHVPRYGHSAIINGDNIVVVGDRGTKPTEMWSINEDEYSYARRTSPILSLYINYPELLLVDSDYCTTNQTILV